MCHFLTYALEYFSCCFPVVTHAVPAFRHDEQAGMPSSHCHMVSSNARQYYKRRGKSGRRNVDKIHALIFRVLHLSQAFRVRCTRRTALRLGDPALGVPVITSQVNCRSLFDSGPSICGCWTKLARLMRRKYSGRYGRRRRSLSDHIREKRASFRLPHFRRLRHPTLTTVPFPFC